MRRQGRGTKGGGLEFNREDQNIGKEQRGSASDKIRYCIGKNFELHLGRAEGNSF